MPKYGKIVNGELVTSEVMSQGYKLIKYADVPEFDQTSYFVTQKEPIETEDHIFIDIEMNELPKDEEVDGFEEDVF